MDGLAILELRRAWGPVLEVWEGYATDPEIRFLGSSGGLVTALSLYGIERARMQGVLHVGPLAEDPLANVAVISRNRQELLKRTGSRYAPAGACSGLGLLNGDGGPFMFAGKPCDVAAVRKWQTLRSEMADRIAIVISIFCAGTPSTRGSLKILEKLGVQPSQVNPRAIQVMAEVGIDIGGQRSKSVAELAEEQFDLVITLCDHAQQQCPFFPGDTEVMHAGFPDPARVTGTEAEIMAVFRQVRDALRSQLVPLLKEKSSAPAPKEEQG